MQKQKYINRNFSTNDDLTFSKNPHPISNLQNKNKKEKYILYKKSIISNSFKKISVQYKNQDEIIDCKNYNEFQQNKKNKNSKFIKRFSILPKKEINNNITNDTSDNNNNEFHSTFLNSSKSTYTILLKKKSKIKNKSKDDKIVDNENKKVNTLYKNSMVWFKKSNYNKLSSSYSFKINNKCKKAISSKIIFPKHQTFIKGNRKSKIMKNINNAENDWKNKTINNMIIKNKSQIYKKHKFNKTQNNKNNFAEFLEERQKQKILSTKKSRINNNKMITYNKNKNEKKTKHFIYNTKSVTNLFHNQLNYINNSFKNKTSYKEVKTNKKIKTIKLNKISSKNTQKNRNIEISINNNNNLSNTKPTNFSSFINSEKNGLNLGLVSSKKFEDFNLNNNSNTIINGAEGNNLSNTKFSYFIEHMKFLYKNFENQNNKQDNSKFKENDSKFLNYDLGKTNGLSFMIDSFLRSNNNTTLNNIDNSKNIYDINNGKNMIECEKTIGEIEKLANEMFSNSNIIGNDIASNEDADIEEFKEGEDIQKILSLDIKTRQ